MKNQLPDYWPTLKAYHRAREPLYRTIIADLDLPADAFILDAGCGDAYYSRLLIDVIGPGARMIAADRNLANIRSQIQPDDSIPRCLSDIEQAGLRHGSFDAVWLCRALHSTFDPRRRLSALVSLLRSGGRLIVIENDLADCRIPTWPAAFEQRIQLALHQSLQAQCSTGALIERYSAPRHLPGWLAHAELRDITLQTYPVEDVAPMPPAIETYWQLLMKSRSQLLQPFLSAEDGQIYARAFDPDCSDYILSQPGIRCLEPITVVCGYMP